MEALEEQPSRETESGTPTSCTTSGHSNVCCCRKGCLYSDEEKTALCLVAMRLTIETGKLNFHKIGDTASKVIPGRTPHGLSTHLYIKLLPNAVEGNTPQGLTIEEKNRFIRLARIWSDVKKLNSMAYTAYGNVNEIEGNDDGGPNDNDANVNIVARRQETMRITNLDGVNDDEEFNGDRFLSVEMTIGNLNGPDDSEVLTGNDESANQNDLDSVGLNGDNVANDSGVSTSGDGGTNQDDKDEMNDVGPIGDSFGNDSGVSLGHHGSISQDQVKIEDAVLDDGVANDSGVSSTHNASANQDEASKIDDFDNDNKVTTSHNENPDQGEAAKIDDAGLNKVANGNGVSTDHKDSNDNSASMNVLDGEMLSNNQVDSHDVNGQAVSNDDVLALPDKAGKEKVTTGDVSSTDAIKEDLKDNNDPQDVLIIDLGDTDEEFDCKDVKPIIMIDSDESEPPPPKRRVRRKLHKKKVEKDDEVEILKVIKITSSKSESSKPKIPSRKSAFKKFNKSKRVWQPW